MRSTADIAADTQSGALRAFIEEDEQIVPAEIDEKLEPHLQALKKTPDDRDALSNAALVLANNGYLTKAVPYSDKFVAVGGSFNDIGTTNYIKGLCQLGRFDDADRVLREFEARLPGFTLVKDTREYFHVYRCRYACRVEKNLINATAAFVALHNNFVIFDYPAYSDRAAEDIQALAESQLADGKLAGQLEKLDELWPLIPPERVKAWGDELRKSNVQPTSAMVDACDPLNGSKMASPGAYMLRSRHTANVNRDFKLAAALADRCVEAARAQGKLEPLLYALQFQFVMAHVRADLAITHASCLEQLKIAEALNIPGTLSTVQMIVAMNYEQMGDSRAAVELFEKGLQIANKYGEHYMQGQFQRRLSRAACDMGRASEMEPYFRRLASGYQQSTPDHPPYEYYDLGICLTRQGKHDEAIRWLRRAENLEHDYPLRRQIALGRALLATGDATGAEKACDEAQRLEKTLKNADLRWKWQFGKAQARLAQNDSGGAQQWVNKALETIEQQRASLTDYHQRRSLLDQKSEVFDFAIELALKRGDNVQALLLAERSRARTFLDALGARVGNAAESVISDVGDLKSVQQGFSTVIFYTRERDVLAWLVRDHGVEFLTIEYAKAELEKDVTRLHQCLATDVERTPKNIAATHEASRVIYQRLWRPVEKMLKADERVCIVPHRLLHYVPFQALLDGPKFLVEKRDLFYAPSGSALAQLCRRRRKGDASVAVFDATKSKDPRSAFFQSPTEALKKEFPNAAVFMPRQATLTEFKKCADAGLIHISAHGSFDSWIPSRSGLQLMPQGRDDGMLRAEHVYEMKLNKTALVVLCSCVSSVGDLADGDEVTGVTRAFQVAGSQNVIGSLWPVEVGATTKLMGIFYEELKKSPDDPTRALCEAQRRYLKDDRDAAHWAAFEVNGNGRIGK